MVTDPIADMLARIRNAAVAHHDTTRMTASKMKLAIGEILKREGYIADVRTDDGNGAAKDKAIIVALKYADRGPAFQGLKRVSRPGRRVYARHDHIPRVLSGLGVAIVSTSRGLMTDKEARKQRIGGEILCEVW